MAYSACSSIGSGLVHLLSSLPPRSIYSIYRHIAATRSGYFSPTKLLHSLPNDVAMDKDPSRPDKSGLDLRVDTNPAHFSIPMHRTHSPSILEDSTQSPPQVTDPALITRGQLTFVEPQHIPQPVPQNAGHVLDGSHGFVSDSSSSGHSVTSRHPFLAKCVKKVKRFWRKHYSYYRWVTVVDATPFLAETVMITPI